LFESELFGHEKGAFTGAIGQKKGKFELAAGGTVFLDEIGELAPALQAKLLRVLQEREFERVGGARPLPLNIRLIAATNKDLEQAIKTGAFREDLFYRLNALEARIPPLRERRGDTPQIAEHLVAKYAAEAGRRVNALSPAACQLLLSYSWPGNVRELENAMRHAVVFCNTETIEPDDLPDHIIAAPDAPDAATPAPQPVDTPPPVLLYRDALREAKRRIILRAIEHTENDLHRAAELLGIHVNNLYRHLRELGLRPPK
jgi:transcriptional regulator with PAS, ATPase and Fis domain